MDGLGAEHMQNSRRSPREAEFTCRDDQARELLLGYRPVGLPEGDDEDVAMSWRVRIDGFDGCNAVRHARVVNERGVERIGQCEPSQAAAIEAMNARDPARNVLPTDKQHDHVVHSVTVETLGRWPPRFLKARFNAKLVYFDV